MNDTLNTRKPIDMLGWALLVASPFLLLAIVSLALRANAFAAYPCWSDELECWRGVRSWLAVGMNAGYSGLAESIPRFGALGLSGFTPVLLYGGFGALFGWSANGVVICNALWIAAGALTLCLLCKPRALASLLLSLSLMAYLPIVLYCTTSMAELAQYGLLLFYIAFLLRYARTRGVPSLVLCVVTTLLCCAVRVSYCVLFLPLTLVACDYRFSGKAALCALAALLASAGVFAVATLYASPNTSGFLFHFLREGDVGLALKMLASHAKSNLRDLLDLNLVGTAQLAQRALYLLMMLGCLIGSFVRGKAADKPRRRLNGELFVCFLALFVPLLISIALFETNDWNDYRTLAPFLWGVSAVLLLRSRKHLPALFLIGCAVMLGLFLIVGEPSTAFTDASRFVAPTESADTRALCEAIEYDENADEPFGNSVRIDLYNWQTISQLDAGLGLQSGWFTEDNVGHSRWILTDRLKVALQGYELILSNADGSVYRLLSATATD